MIARIAFGLFLLFLYVSCGSAPDSDRSEEGREGADNELTVQSTSSVALPSIDSGPVLLVLGGSFSAAQGLDPDAAYASHLQARLSEAGATLKVINASISNETASGMLERLPFLLELPIQQAILELGQTDEAKGTAVAAFTRDVNKLLRGIRTRYPEAPILLLPSTRSKAYQQAISDATARLEGFTISKQLLDAGPPIRSGDAELHRRLAGELWGSMRF
ncbi:MAG: hypothetical protein KDD02_01965 [Phaeodactylibacter sp.]|nr:hypothetical protein [Phaeodactylibacter sp.]MCB9299153.1 hypothetical protein [Lewinellaceae bacterium]HQU59208.1 GDSL-type esterase/lipase family protein [Saprospiraceae bacterium]